MSVFESVGGIKGEVAWLLDRETLRDIELACGGDRQTYECVRNLLAIREAHGPANRRGLLAELEKELRRHVFSAGWMTVQALQHTHHDAQAGDAASHSDPRQPR